MAWSKAIPCTVPVHENRNVSCGLNPHKMILRMVYTINVSDVCAPIRPCQYVTKNVTKLQPINRSCYLTAALFRVPRQLRLTTLASCRDWLCSPTTTDTTWAQRWSDSKRWRIEHKKKKKRRGKKVWKNKIKWSEKNLLCNKQITLEWYQPCVCCSHHDHVSLYLPCLNSALTLGWWWYQQTHRMLLFTIHFIAILLLVTKRFATICSLPFVWGWQSSIQ